MFRRGRDGALRSLSEDWQEDTETDSVPCRKMQISDLGPGQVGDVVYASTTNVCPPLSVDHYGNSVTVCELPIRRARRLRKDRRLGPWQMSLHRRRLPSYLGTG